MSRVAVVLVSIVVMITLSEFALRLYDYPRPIRYGWVNEGSEDISTGDDEYVIVLLGDSQAVNRGEKKVDRSYAPGNILERRLNGPDMANCRLPDGKELFKVVTIAAGGWGQGQQLLALRNYFDVQRANLVALWLTPENDLWNNAFPTAYGLNGTPKPTFVIDDTGSPSQVPRSDIIPWWIDFKLGLLVNAAVQNIGQDREFRGYLQRWFSVDKTAPFLLWNPDYDWDRYLPPAAQHSNDKIYVDGNSFLRDYNVYMKKDPINLEKSHFALGLNPNSNRVEWMVELTRLLIKEIGQVASDSGSGFLSFSYDASNTGLPLYPLDGDYVYFSRRFSYSESARQRRFEAMLRGLAHHTIYLEPGEWRKGGYDAHLDVKANSFVMSALEEILRREICIDSVPSSG